MVHSTMKLSHAPKEIKTPDNMIIKYWQHGKDLTVRSGKIQPTWIRKGMLAAKQNPQTAAINIEWPWKRCLM